MKSCVACGWFVHTDDHVCVCVCVCAPARLPPRAKGKPTVILAQTIKGYGLGTTFEGRNATHQMKELTIDEIKLFRDRHRIPVTDEEIEKDQYAMPYYHPGQDAPEIKYLQERRQKLGGYVPVGVARDTTRCQCHRSLLINTPVRVRVNEQIATTMAFVRLLRDLMRDKNIGKRIVPIIPDEAPYLLGMNSFPNG